VLKDKALRTKLIELTEPNLQYIYGTVDVAIGIDASPYSLKEYS